MKKWFNTNYHYMVPEIDDNTEIKIAAAYREYLEKFYSLSAEWVEFDEPYPVMDLSENDVELFRNLYEKILEKNVMLQTYFGVVRDCYKEICELPFDGIGLDFIECKKSLELVKENGFPSGKILFAGVINGKISGGIITEIRF